MATIKSTYQNTLNQIAVLNKQGEIEETDSYLLEHCAGKKISEVHPFFETVQQLINNNEEEHNFLCVNLDINNQDYIVDITLYNENEKSILVINDLTKQYNKFQKAAQQLNESKIKTHILDFENQLLIEKENFKNNFIANFSHEIRMPINSIIGFSNLLSNTSLEQDQHYNVKIIKNTSDKLKTMINDILDISKIETQYFTLLEDTYNFIQEIEILQEIYTIKAKEKGLDFNVEIDEKCPEYVFADKYRIAQILRNLIENAIKFTNTGTISLLIKPKQKTGKAITIEFKIKDTGIGIEKNKIDDIFEGFYQINNNISNDGVGLGLAIVNKLVAALNGTIKVKSKTNEGSTFTVLLDLKVAKGKPKNLASPIVKSIEEKKRVYEYKILIAETIIKDKTRIVEILSRNKKNEIVVVDTGDEVLKELHKTNYDLVILNLNLPIIDGLGTTRHIRLSEFSEFSEIPIIAVSEKPSKEEEKMCKQNKINSYLGKPYNRSEVLRKVKYILQKKTKKK